jgi:cysteine desulfuration protein SufE
MGLAERQRNIILQFAKFSTWEEKYRHIITLGKRMPVFPEEFRQDDLRVKGCQAQVWLHAARDSEGRVEFVADADALIVKGLVALLIQLYSKATPDEILATAPDFIAELDLSSHLSPSRANGLFAMVKQMKYYAAAFKALCAN